MVVGLLFFQELLLDEFNPFIGFAWICEAMRGDNSLWVTAQSDEVGQLQLSCDASGGSSAAASHASQIMKIMNKTEQSAFSTLQFDTCQILPALFSNDLRWNLCGKSVLLTCLSSGEFG